MSVLMAESVIPKLDNLKKKLEASRSLILGHNMINNRHFEVNFTEDED